MGMEQLKAYKQKIKKQQVPQAFDGDKINSKLKKRRTKDENKS